MPSLLITIAVSITTLFGGGFVLYNYIPLSWLDVLTVEKSPLVGATITTINGSDTLSASRTVINNNFTSLNNGKIENSTTSVASITTLANLVTVGTITSGTWNASTLTVPFGGSASTTLSSNQILLGNGASAIKTVTGYGNSGQLLTSNGVGAAPTWQSASFDTTQDYNLTGTIRIKNLNASSTVANPAVFNGVNFIFPSSQGASSTVLANNGSGVHSFNPLSRLVHMNVSPTQANGTAASTTIFNVTIPGGILGTRHVIRGKLNTTSLRWPTTEVPTFALGYAGASTTVTFQAGNPAGLTNGGGGGDIEFYLAAAGATNSQELTLAVNAATTTGASNSTTAIDSTTDQALVLIVQAPNTTPNNFVMSALLTLELVPF